LVVEWFGIKNILVELLQMSGTDGGFSCASLWDRQNRLAIQAFLEMMTSPDDILRKLMKQFEIEQARNCGSERRGPDTAWNQGFLKWHPTYQRIQFNPGVPTQLILPRGFKARPKDGISFWVGNGWSFLAHPVEGVFAQSRTSNSSMWIARCVGRLMYRQHFREGQVIVLNQKYILLCSLRTGCEVFTP
jgi:hypothetical protein